ncbi:MAG: molybdopterin biosynthesis protein, partial [Candidatus Bathyarchaeia archaeon]
MAQNSIADVRRRGFSKLMSVKDALSSFFEQCKLPRLAAEIVPVHDALGRVLAEDVVCQRDVPPFNRSAVDGFAVRSEDTFGCSPTNPVVLQVIGTSYVANMPEITLGRHQAMKIMTGAPMPHGSDAVVMIEYTELTRED